MSCAHIASVGADQPAPITRDGCTGCRAVGRSDWVHLRMCLACGYVGCCASSPLQHAEVHFEDSDHPVMRSFEPGESWRWCYLDEILG